jgi:hypothetical protein
VQRETDPGKVREISAKKNRFIQESLKDLIRTCDNKLVDFLGNKPFFEDGNLLPIIHYISKNGSYYLTFVQIIHPNRSCLYAMNVQGL